jgi:glyoxylase I family protein
MRFDHLVLWVEDPLRSVEFYERVLGFPGVRKDEFAAGKAPFPSVRVSEHSIVDLMSLKAAPILNAVPGAAGSAGNKVNHLCFAMDKAEYDALRARLDASGVAVAFTDPDGNVLEARYY